MLDITSIPIPNPIPQNENAGRALCILTWTLFGVSTAFLIGRLVSKVFIPKQFALDDALMLASWVSWSCRSRANTPEGEYRALTGGSDLYFSIVCERPRGISLRPRETLYLLDHPACIANPEVELCSTCVLHCRTAMRAHLRECLPAGHHWKGKKWCQILAVVAHLPPNSVQHWLDHSGVQHMRLTILDNRNV